MKTVFDVCYNEKNKCKGLGKDMGMINQLRLASAFVFPRTGDSFKMIFVVIAVIAVLAVVVCLLLPKLTKKKSDETTAQGEDTTPSTDEEATGQSANEDTDADSSDEHSSDN